MNIVEDKKNVSKLDFVLSEQSVNRGNNEQSQPAVNYLPLRLCAFQQELEEAANEPLPIIETLEDIEDTDTDCDEEVSNSIETLKCISEEQQNKSICGSTALVSQNNLEINLKIENAELKPSKFLTNIGRNINTTNTEKIRENVSDKPSSSLSVQNRSKDSIDLGVNWLITPGKQKFNNCTTPSVYTKTTFITPTISRSKMLVPNSCGKEKYTTPNISKNGKYITSNTSRNDRQLLSVSTNCTPTSKYRSCLYDVIEEIPRIQSGINIRTNEISPNNKLPETCKKSNQKLRPVPLLNIYRPINVNSHNFSSNPNVNGILQEKNEKENVCAKTNNLPISTVLSNILDQFKIITVQNVNYIILNQLGRGGSSVVYHCFEPVTKSVRAIKKVNLSASESAVAGYINEVKLLHKLQNCDRIIKMYAYEILESEKVLLMVLEKGDVDLGKIVKDVSNSSSHIPVHMIIFYWMEMLYAVKEIHENGIIHSDLKPANFLKVSGGLKLIDFGIASSLQGDMTSIIKDVPVGSFNYVSPEALKNNSSGDTTPCYKLSCRSDVWSLGCILYQLVYRKTPFQHIGHMYAKLMAIVDPEQKIDYPELDWVPSQIVKTIKECLQYNMKSRPSVNTLIKDYENIYD